MRRVLFFLLLSVAACTGPVWLFVSGLLAYGVFFSGIEIIFLAALVDALFMNSTAVIPVYTLLAIVWLIIVEFVKPHIVLYNQT